MKDCSNKFLIFIAKKVSAGSEVISILRSALKAVISVRFGTFNDIINKHLKSAQKFLDVPVNLKQLHNYRNIHANSALKP